MKLLRSEVEFIKAMIPDGEKLLNDLAVQELSRRLFHLYFETETYNSKQKQLRKLLRYIWWLAKKVDYSEQFGQTEELIIEEDVEITEEVKRKLEKLPVELKEFLRDKEWRDVFSPLTLYRAEKLSYTGVQNVCKTFENTYYAEVQGAKTYYVEVSENLHEYCSCTAFCTCPYSKREDFCKHMAAVLFYVERNRDKIPWEEDLTAETTTHFYESLIDENGRLTNSRGFWITKDQIAILKTRLSPKEYVELMNCFEDDDGWWEGEEPFLVSLDDFSYTWETEEEDRIRNKLADLYDQIYFQNQSSYGARGGTETPTEADRETGRNPAEEEMDSDDGKEWAERSDVEETVEKKWDYLYVGVSPKGQYDCNYWYIDEAKQTQADTYIWVKMGPKDKEQLVYVDSVRYCNADEVPYPIEKTKRVIRQATEEEAAEADVLWDE